MKPPNVYYLIDPELMGSPSTITGKAGSIFLQWTSLFWFRLLKDLILPGFSQDDEKSVLWKCKIKIIQFFWIMLNKVMILPHPLA